MNKKNLTSFMFLMVLMFSFSLVAAADNSMRVIVDFKASSVGISVPTQVIFEDIAKGYISQKESLTIENTGTVDMHITPQLGNYSGDIFTNLVFQRVLADPMTSIGDFQFNIDKPTIAGSTRDENIYMYLDLTSYEGNSSLDVTGHDADVIFWATAQ